MKNTHPISDRNRVIEKEKRRKEEKKKMCCEQLEIELNHKIGHDSYGQKNKFSQTDWIWQ